MTRQPNQTEKSERRARRLPVLSEKALAQVQGGVGFFQRTAAHGDEAGSSSGSFV